MITEMKKEEKVWSDKKVLNFGQKSEREMERLEVQALLYEKM